MAAAAGLTLAGLGGYVLVRAAAPEGVQSHTAWYVFFATFLIVAGAASIAGTVVRSPALGAHLLTAATGALAGLILVLIFSIGLLLAPLAVGVVLAAAGRAREAAVSPPSLVLAGTLPVLVLFLGLFTLYR